MERDPICAEIPLVTDQIDLGHSTTLLHERLLPNFGFGFGLGYQFVRKENSSRPPRVRQALLCSCKCQVLRFYLNKILKRSLGCHSEH